VALTICPNHLKQELEERLASLKPTDCCSLVYTSGTTGNPKGVMLSHDNCMWTSYVGAVMMKVSDGDSLVSYLPLSHVAAQIIDVYAFVQKGFQVTFAQPDAMRGSLKSTLADTNPCIFFGVPRIWEKISDSIKEAGKQNSTLKAWISSWARGRGLVGGYAAQEGTTMPWGYGLANALVFKKVRQRLSFEKACMLATAAAPISLETLEFFLSLGIPVQEVYGISEGTGPVTLNTPDHLRTGTVGISMIGTEVKISEPDSNGEGEIIFRGRNRFMGYANMEKETAEVIDEDGFFHTGDIGTVDADGFFRITGRKKELIITSGGENIPPVLIENAIKEKLPMVSNAMVVGDCRKYLSVILTLKTRLDYETGLPSRVLSPLALSTCEEIGSTATTTEETTSCEKIRQHITEKIEEANALSTSRAQRVQKFTLLVDDFTIVGGELTPTMKLKRKAAQTKYKSQIESMYTE
jgi:long-chain-fatty-acid--CoA ligase ACSBG